MADGDVPLDGERGDGENGRVGRRLGGHRPHHAERLTEYPRVRRPDVSYLLRRVQHSIFDSATVGRFDPLPRHRDWCQLFVSSYL